MEIKFICLGIAIVCILIMLIFNTWYLNVLGKGIDLINDNLKEEAGSIRRRLLDLRDLIMDLEKSNSNCKNYIKCEKENCKFYYISGESRFCELDTYDLKDKQSYVNEYKVESGGDAEC